MAQIRQFTHVASPSRRSARTATVRMMAALLALLAATPFTAPFPTCSLAVLLSSTPGAHAVTVPPSSPVLAPALQSGREYPPASMTEEQFKGKSSTVDESPDSGSDRTSVTPVAVAPLAAPRTFSHAVLVLRL